MQSQEHKNVVQFSRCVWKSLLIVSAVVLSGCEIGCPVTFSTRFGSLEVDVPMYGIWLLPLILGIGWITVHKIIQRFVLNGWRPPRKTLFILCTVILLTPWIPRFFLACTCLYVNTVFHDIRLCFLWPTYNDLSCMLGFIGVFLCAGLGLIVVTLLQFGRHSDKSITDGSVICGIYVILYTVLLSFVSLFMVSESYIGVWEFGMVILLTESVNIGIWVIRKLFPESGSRKYRNAQGVPSEQEMEIHLDMTAAPQSHFMVSKLLFSSRKNWRYVVGILLFPILFSWILLSPVLIHWYDRADGSIIPRHEYQIVAFDKHCITLEWRRMEPIFTDDRSVCASAFCNMFHDSNEFSTIPLAAMICGMGLFVRWLRNIFIRIEEEEFQSGCKIFAHQLPFLIILSILFSGFWLY